MLNYIEASTPESRESAYRQYSDCRSVFKYENKTSFSGEEIKPSLYSDIILINEQKRTVSRAYVGRTYYVRDILLGEFSLWIRIIRAALAIFLTIASLGIALCFHQTRAFLAEKKFVVLTYTHYKDSEPGKTINDHICERRRFLKVVSALGIELFGSPLYVCQEAWSDKITESVWTDYELYYDAVEIRDMLEWMPAERISIGRNEFQNAKYTTIETLIRAAEER